METHEDCVHEDRRWCVKGVFGFLLNLKSPFCKKDFYKRTFSKSSFLKCVWLEESLVWNERKNERATSEREETDL